MSTAHRRPLPLLWRADGAGCCRLANDDGQPLSRPRQLMNTLTPSPLDLLASPPRCRRPFADPSPHSLWTQFRLVVRRDVRTMHRRTVVIRAPSRLQRVGPTPSRNEADAVSASTSLKSP